MHWADALNILQIIIIDIVLSGDNAVVIALAAHKLPIHQRKRAILWGGGIAIGMRIAFTMLMAFLLMVPGLRFFGGILLVWIACKLLIGEEEEGEVTADDADRSTLQAIKMIFLADFVMSLDNMLAVAGASHGNATLLLFGLFVSIGIIMTCSAFIAQLMNRYHWIVYVGAAILAWTAGEMLIGDRELAGYFVRQQNVSLSNHWDEWLESHADVHEFQGEESLSSDLKPLVHYRPGTEGLLAKHGQLTYIGQMPVEHRDELLQRVSSAEDKKAIEDMYEVARVQDVPAWVPEGVKGHVAMWFQHRWPAEYAKAIEGRKYPWVAWIFQSLVVLFCLTAPKWLGKRKEEKESAVSSQ